MTPGWFYILLILDLIYLDILFSQTTHVLIVFLIRITCGPGLPQRGLGFN